jgi:Zn-dependent protease
MGCYSRYVLSPIGLILTLITAVPFIPFKVIMPGFTLVVPTKYDPWFLKRLNGIVSFMGPLTNMLNATITLAVYAFMIKMGYYIPLLLLFLLLNAYWNAWIALFNLIPVPPLDGSKVISWKPHIWITSLLFSLGLLIVSGHLLHVF